MFNFFKRKEPEKPNFIGEQHEHKGCLMVFENTEAAAKIDKLRESYHKTSLLKGKTSTRMKAMIDDCDKISVHHVELQQSSISGIRIARSQQEMLAVQMGFIEPSPIQGIAICPGCLQQAIVSCEEVLQSLKDIQEATKEYV